MANTLTALAPTLYSAAQEVSNEPFGIVDSIYSDFDNKGVAKGDKVKVPIAPLASVTDFTPSNVASTGSDKTASDVEVEITASKKTTWHLTGEQQRSLENGGTNQEWIRQLIAQGMRSLRNLAEADGAKAVALGASRAVGTAGTTPFASDLKALTSVRQVLRDNGAPMSDLQLVVDTAAEKNLLDLSIIAQADQAGTAEERRQGRLLRQYGFQIGQSAGIYGHTAGDGENLEMAAGEKGDTTITLTDGGTWSGSVLAGDVIKIGDHYYTVLEGTADVTDNAEITINRPGLVEDVAEDTAVVIQSAYTGNVAFERNSVVGIMRPPLIPANPTINQLVISDNFGMSYLLLDIAQYGQRTWELHLAWGFQAVQPEHIGLVMG